MKPFNERVHDFNEILVAAQKEHGVSLYAANIVLKNGEVIPLVRVSDNLAGETVPVPQNAYENQSQGRSSAGEEASTNAPKSGHSGRRK
jgi:hypothetical protein